MTAEDTPRTNALCQQFGDMLPAIHFRALERENAALREMLDLVFRIPNMTDAELAELIRNCRAAIDAARKEQP